MSKPAHVSQQRCNILTVYPRLPRLVYDTATLGRHAIHTSQDEQWREDNDACDRGTNDERGQGVRY